MNQIENILDNIHTAEEKFELLQQIMQVFPVGVVIINNGQFCANRKFYQLIEQTEPFQTVEDYQKNCCQDYILYDKFSALLQDASSFTRLYSIKTQTNQEYYVENTTVLIPDEQQTPFYVTTLIDRTDANTVSIQFAALKEKLHIVEDLIDEYIFEYDFTKDILRFSERWKPDGINTEYPHAQKWLELHEIIHVEELPFLLAAMNSSRFSREIRTFDFRAKFLKDDYNWYRISYKLVRSKPTNTLRAVGKITNINKEHLSSNMEVPEGVDAKTGLLLPTYMQNYVDPIIKEESPGSLCALLLLQLDNFAELKKSTGDLYASRIEYQVAQRLKNSFRNTDVLGYYQDGGFMIFLRKVPENIVTQRANDVLQSIGDIPINGVEQTSLSSSIGISLSPLDGSSYMELFLKADSAMYLSKARGGDTYSYFNTNIDARQRSTKA